ncbi:hypothetical protein Tco_0215005 [Tanacetum coccineum]
MEEINNFQQEPNETLYQAWERFKELLMKCPQHYLMEMQEVILFYNRLEVPTRQILDSRGVIPSKTAADAKVAIQEMDEYSLKWNNGTSRTRSTETSDGLAAIKAQLNNLGREIKKVNEKVYAAQVGCEQCKRPHYTKDRPLKEEGKTLEEAYYTQFGGPFQGGGYRAAAPGFYQRNNAKPSYQERRQSMDETLSKFMSESAKRHEENSNMIKEILASTDAVVRNQGASIKTLEIQIGQISKLNVSYSGITGIAGIIIMENIYNHGEQLNIIWLNASYYNGKITVVILVRDRFPRGRGNLPRLPIKKNIVHLATPSMGIQTGAVTPNRSIHSIRVHSQCK